MVTTSKQVAFAVAAFAIIALTMVPSADALKCYICNSKYNGTTCLTPPNKQHLVDCPLINGQTATYCRTMYITMGMEDSTVDRRCGHKNQGKACLNTATFQIKSTTCQCEGDGCNPAASTAAPALLLVALSALLGVALSRGA